MSAPSVREYIDNDTAATISVTQSGWIFARERSDLAVHAQDYITITPVLVNRAGRRAVYLYCQLWSTIDRRRDTALVPANAELALIADDRRVALPRTMTDTRSLGIGTPPIELPTKSAQVFAVSVDNDLMRFIAGADQVRIAIKLDDATDYYLSWRDGRAAYVEFLRRIEAGS